VRLEQVLAPCPESPPGQLELRVTLRIECLVDQTVLRLEQQVFQRNFGPDVGENSAHGFPSLGVLGPRSGLSTQARALPSGSTKTRGIRTVASRRRGTLLPSNHLIHATA